MDTEWTLLLRVLQVILIILQVILIPAAGWLIKAYIASRKEIADLNNRITKNEERLEKLPGSGDWHDLALSIESMRGDLKAVVSKVDGVEKVMDRMDGVLSRQEEYLLNCGVRK